MLQVASQENGNVSHVTVLGNDLVRLLACSSFFFPVETGFVEVTRDEVPDGIYLEWMTFLFGNIQTVQTSYEHGLGNPPLDSNSGPSLGRYLPSLCLHFPGGEGDENHSAFMWVFGTK